MVKEILAKGHPKVKWGKIFNIIRFAWMTYQNVRLDMHIPNIYTFTIILTLILEIITFKHICTAFVEQEVPMCKLLIFNYRKSISDIIPNFVPILFYPGYKLNLKEWTRHVAKYSLREISETLNGHISKVLLCDLSTSYTTLFNC